MPERDFDPNSLSISQPRSLTRLGLSAKLLILTTLFVMLAEVLIYLPSIANYRRNWLNDRLAAAQIAVLVLEGAPNDNLPEGSEERLLAGVGARAIAARVGGARRLLSLDAMPPEVAQTVDLRNLSRMGSIMEAVSTLLRPAHKLPIRVVGQAVGAADFVELVIDEAPLRQAMLKFSWNLLLISLLISALSAGMIYFALNWLIVTPIRRLAANVMEFENDPENPYRIIAPSDRVDEVGEAERALARMQATLASDLRAKKHLAELGLAVSKINHDLRNMLAAAQLMSDRLTETRDAKIRSFAPRLIATLDRAIEFCQATLAYGRAAEATPRLRDVVLRQLVAEQAELLGLSENGAVGFANQVPASLVASVDPDQMARVLSNLMRNAIRALDEGAEQDGRAPILTISGGLEGNELVLRVADNGPGVPARARQNLFQAFRGSVTPGGTGLGLAIAAELVRLHGGMIHLEPSELGAVFKVTLPGHDARA
ncbi:MULTISPECIES: sensor histidine kinase [Bosea]|jgi:signal transduction histidine kinase|uniref:histidine kinase n=1 Tax=Bosea rubneri TaxID=3075434 RepID=A0ABU3S1S1_9HYPH|nr:MULTISPECIES: HAMP domain-containing sensor histidine kinase [unclassified Bosea (in: a-proteobacteria)]MDU0338710.1 HAMP domain-containing sensor histidine kinase [Bosea sp. ZW T0_25]HEV7336539.1 HAMP domain-containing sensor histidine kinase [Bosea sp. (in: a-proteobacteria)]